MQPPGDRGHGDERYGITCVTYCVTASEGVKALNCSLRATGGAVTRGKVSQKSHSRSERVKGTIEKSRQLMSHHREMLNRE